MIRFMLLGFVLTALASGCNSNVASHQAAKLPLEESAGQYSSATAFAAAFGFEPSAADLNEFQAWLDHGADSSRIPQGVVRQDTHAIEVVREFDQAFPGAPAAFVRTRSGTWDVILGGGNFGIAKLDYCLLIENGAVRWIPDEQVRQRWNGLAVILRDKSKAIDQPLWTHAPVIELGEIEDQSGKAETLVLNRTDSMVTITDAQFDCTCGNIVFHDEKIPPFGIGRARIGVNATGKAEGALALRLSIATDPAADTPLLIRIKGEVVRSTRLEPPFIDIGNVTSSKKPMVVESVLHLKRPVVGELFPGYLPEGVRWKGSTFENKKSIRIQLEVDPARVPFGDFRLATAIGLRDKSEQTETLHSLPIAGKRLPVMQFAPAEVSVNCRPGQKIHRSVRVFKEGDDPVQVTSANFQGVTPKVDGQSIELEIEAPGRTGPFEVLVFARAGDAYGLIPVRGIVERESTVADSAKSATAAE